MKEQRNAVNAATTLAFNAREPAGRRALLMRQVFIGDNLDKSHISGRIFSFSARLDNKPAPSLSENGVFVFPAPRARLPELSSPRALLILDLG